VSGDDSDARGVEQALAVAVRSLSFPDFWGILVGTSDGTKFDFFLCGFTG
jgi:hypothetical protein